MDVRFWLGTAAASAALGLAALTGSAVASADTGDGAGTKTTAHSARSEMLTPRTFAASYKTSLSDLEIQKLMYFAASLEPRLALDFAPGRYGPYSEKVRHQLSSIEGAYTTGFGDGTAKALDHEPISLTDRGIRALDEYIASGKEASTVIRIVDAVLEIIDGFEGPYGVELLASTHWVATHEGATEHATAATAVRSWTKRKGRIYTDDRVGIALDRVLATTASV